MIFKKFIMRMKYKILFLISCILLSTGLQAVILNKEEAGKADLTMLEDEIELFKSIGMGITLSVLGFDHLTRAKSYHLRKV